MENIYKNSNHSQFKTRTNDEQTLSLYNSCLMKIFMLIILVLDIVINAEFKTTISGSTDEVQCLIIAFNKIILHFRNEHYFHAYRCCRHNICSYVDDLGYKKCKN